MSEELNNAGGLAAIVAAHKAKMAEVDREAAALASIAQPALVEASDTKPGYRTTEFWLALLLPAIVGAVVQLGWLSEDAATQLGLAGGSAYILGRNAVKFVGGLRR